MKPIELTEEINGIHYFSVKAFALATSRSEQNIRFLITNGNRLRTLRADRIMEKPMIPYSELLEFPFTLAGRNSEEVWHYNENGEQFKEELNGVQDSAIRASAQSLRTV